MENSVNVYIHTFISIYIYMYIYWYNWYTILSNPHKHCVSERATFSISLAQCATRLVYPPWLTTRNRTNLSSLIFHFSSPSCMYHFRYLPSGTLFCPFFPRFYPFSTLHLEQVADRLVGPCRRTFTHLCGRSKGLSLPFQYMRRSLQYGRDRCLGGGGLFGENLIGEASPTKS
jgi:hypothetical protein